MNAPELLDTILRTSFHDSGIQSLWMKGDHVHLEFEDVWLNDDYATNPGGGGFDVDGGYRKGTFYGVTVDLRGVRTVTRNDEPVSQLSMEAEDSSVIAFELHVERQKNQPP